MDPRGGRGQAFVEVDSAVSENKSRLTSGKKTNGIFLSHGD